MYNLVGAWKASSNSKGYLLDLGKVSTPICTHKVVLITCSKEKYIIFQQLVFDYNYKYFVIYIIHTKLFYGSWRVQIKNHTTSIFVIGKNKKITSTTKALSQGKQLPLNIFLNLIHPNLFNTGLIR